MCGRLSIATPQDQLEMRFEASAAGAIETRYNALKRRRRYGNGNSPIFTTPSSTPEVSTKQDKMPSYYGYHPNGSPANLEAYEKRSR